LVAKIVAPIAFSNARSSLQEIVFCPSGVAFYGHLLDSSLNEAVTSLSNYSNRNGELNVPIEILQRLTGNIFVFLYFASIDDWDYRYY